MVRPAIGFLMDVPSAARNVMVRREDLSVSTLTRQISVVRVTKPQSVIPSCGLSTLEQSAGLRRTVTTTVPGELQAVPQCWTPVGWLGELLGGVTMVLSTGTVLTPPRGTGPVRH